MDEFECNDRIVHKTSSMSVISDDKSHFFPIFTITNMYKDEIDLQFKNKRITITIFKLNKIFEGCIYTQT